MPVRPLRGDTTVLPRPLYDAALLADAARWDLHSDLGSAWWGWTAFTESEREGYALMVEFGILAHVVLAAQEHQQSRRVGPPVQENSNASWIARCLGSLSRLW